MFAVHFLTNYYFTEENRELYKWCGITINNLALELHIQKIGQFCRALFAFVSGYAIYEQREKYQSVVYCLKRIVKLLCKYWIVLFAFYLVGLLSREPLPDKKTILYNMLGYGLNQDFYCPIYMAYISFYIALILLAPVWIRIFRYYFLVEIIEILFLRIIIVNVVLKLNLPDMISWGLNYVTTYLGGAALIGYMTAQAKFYEKIKVKLPFWCLVIIAGVVLWIPSTRKSGLLDIVAAPIFVFSLLKMIEVSRGGYKVKRVLGNIGEASLNMWIISCIVATPNGTFQGLFIWPRQAFLIWINALFACYFLSIPFTYIQKWLLDSCNKLLCIGKAWYRRKRKDESI